MTDGLHRSHIQDGFSIVEVTIASGLMMVAALAFTELLVSQNKALKSNRSVSVRDELRNSVERFGADPRAINNTMKQGNSLRVPRLKQIRQMGLGWELIPTLPQLSLRSERVEALLRILISNPAAEGNFKVVSG